MSALPVALLQMWNGETRTMCGILVGAILGASFYILIRSYKFLFDRSFDPDYSNTYICRFVLGIISGLIMANVSGLFFHEGDQLAKLGPGLFAMLGGFAVEAVEQVLNRLVEILLSAVRGDASSAAQAKADATIQKTKAEITKRLSAVQGATKDKAIAKAIKEIMDGLG